MARREQSARRLLAFMIAVAICIASSIAYYLGGPDRDNVSSPGPPTISGDVVVPDSTRPAQPPTGDVTKALRDFAMLDQKFEPEWLIRVKRVYWSGNGALWAEATMPTYPTEKAFTIEKICQELSEYVVKVVRRDWPGVSVRTTSGAELITRVKPTDTCRPAS